ncbi:hypothetical protein FJZ33_01660 [Candidatus Poribacteria bacterium]|nr:hypothetical protein [Candidatus Poribacteria bacterium]
MNCNKIKSQLSSYIDGELSEKESFFIREHLLICQDCHQEEEILRKTSHLVKRWENIPAPDSFHQVLLAKADKISHQPQGSTIHAVRPFTGPRWVIKVAFYGVAVLLLFLLIYSFTTSPQRETPSVEPHPIYANMRNNMQEKNIQNPEDLPIYTTMAKIKVLGIWE